MVLKNKARTAYTSEFPQFFFKRTNIPKVSMSTSLIWFSVLLSKKKFLHLKKYFPMFRKRKLIFSVFSSCYVNKAKKRAIKNGINCHLCIFWTKKIFLYVWISPRKDTAISPRKHTITMLWKYTSKGKSEYYRVTML